MWFEFDEIKGAKIFLHSTSPTFRVSKLKGFTVTRRLFVLSHGLVAHDIIPTVSERVPTASHYFDRLAGSIRIAAADAGEERFCLTVRALISACGRAISSVEQKRTVTTQAEIRRHRRTSSTSLQTPPRFITTIYDLRRN